MSFNSRLETPALSSSTNFIDSQTPSTASTYQQHPSQRQELQPICTTALPMVNTENDLLTTTSTIVDDLISSETAVSETTLSSRELLLDAANKHNDYNNDSTFTKETTVMFIEPFPASLNSSSPSSDKPSTCIDQEEGRHPQRLQGSWYTRLFRLERPETRSSVIVESSWLPTGGLFAVRMVMFVYTFTVLLADICRTERIQFEFCFLTQLSYLGLTSYLGVSKLMMCECTMNESTAITEIISERTTAPGISIPVQNDPYSKGDGMHGRYMIYTAQLNNCWRVRGGGKKGRRHIPPPS